MPVTVEMLHLGGIERISWRCLAHGSLILDRVGMSMSFTRPSSKGFDAITFICMRFATATNIFNSYFSVATYPEYSCHGSTNASGIITLIGS
jgi:hypothetical protein